MIEFIKKKNTKKRERFSSFSFCGADGTRARGFAGAVPANFFFILSLRSRGSRVRVLIHDGI